MNRVHPRTAYALNSTSNPHTINVKNNMSSNYTLINARAKLANLLREKEKYLELYNSSKIKLEDINRQIREVESRLES
jgi:hypothetical protein